MNTINNKKKQKTLNILSNPQFILGSIINPINSFNNSFGSIIEDGNNINDDINNENLIRENKVEKNIDAFFGSIIEKPPSPPPIINKLNEFNETDELDYESDSELGNILQEESLQQSNSKKLKQIYPLINIDKLSSSYSSSSKTKSNSIFTNTEIKDKIEKLSENELYEIFKIIKNNNEKYSTNKNGIFINVSTLKKITINEICNFLIFCENNNKIFNQEEQTRDIYRDIILDL